MSGIVLVGRDAELTVIEALRRIKGPDADLDDIPECVGYFTRDERRALLRLSRAAAMLRALAGSRPQPPSPTRPLEADETPRASSGFVAAAWMLVLIGFTWWLVVMVRGGG